MSPGGGRFPLMRQAALPCVEHHRNVILDGSDEPSEHRMGDLAQNPKALRFKSYAEGGRDIISWTTPLRADAVLLYTITLPPERFLKLFELEVFGPEAPLGMPLLRMPKANAGGSREGLHARDIRERAAFVDEDLRRGQICKPHRTGPTGPILTGRETAMPRRCSQEKSAARRSRRGAVRRPRRTRRGNRS